MAEKKLSVDLLKMTGEKAGTVDLSESVFGVVDANIQCVHDAVVALGGEIGVSAREGYRLFVPAWEFVFKQKQFLLHQSFLPLFITSAALSSLR